MNTLVLDKSALVGAPKDFLKNLRKDFDFLLTDTLFHEITTRKLEERQFLSASQKGILARRIEVDLAKAVKEAGNQWLERPTALVWEITQGRSAKYALREELPRWGSLDELLDQTAEACRKYDKDAAELGRIPRPAGHHKADQLLRDCDEQQFFQQLEALSTNPTGQFQTAKRARDFIRSSAEDRALQLPLYSFPRPDWFTYGIQLSLRAFTLWQFWRFWRYGDELKPKKPANPVFDMYYLAFMAIADGLLSSDTGMLKFAWAIWPEKREHIYYFDLNSHKFDRFEPEWSS